MSNDKKEADFDANVVKLTRELVSVIRNDKPEKENLKRAKAWVDTGLKQLVVSLVSDDGVPVQRALAKVYEDTLGKAAHPVETIKEELKDARAAGERKGESKVVQTLKGAAQGAGEVGIDVIGLLPYVATGKAIGVSFNPQRAIVATLMRADSDNYFAYQFARYLYNEQKIDEMGAFATEMISAGTKMAGVDVSALGVDHLLSEMFTGALTAGKSGFTYLQGKAAKKAVRSDGLDKALADLNLLKWAVYLSAPPRDAKNFYSVTENCRLALRESLGMRLRSSPHTLAAGLGHMETRQLSGKELVDLFKGVADPHQAKPSFAKIQQFSASTDHNPVKTHLQNFLSGVEVWDYLVKHEFVLH